jgi:S1-C subfamily serine protease
MVATPPDISAAAPGTAEIPAAVTTQPSQDHSPNPIGSQPVADSPSSADALSSLDAQAPNDVARYEAEQGGLPPGQLAQQGFDNDGELATPFGMNLREARRELKSGQDADGLLITAITKGSPAANAGLRPYSHAVHDALTGVAMAGALVPGGQFAILLIPVIDYMKVGESYDMIIGVDGSRVTNFLDFQDHMRDLQPGEIVYLSVLRDGKRIQVTMPVTADTIQLSTN